MLLLHAGLKKAGSSTIQAFATENAAALRACGVLYAVQGRHERTGHVNLAHALRAHRRFDPRYGNFDTLAREVAAISPRATFLSSEAFEGFEPEQVTKLAEVLRAIDPDVRILFVLRDMVDILPSSYAQKIKYGFNRFDFDAFFAARMRQSRVDVSETLGRWIAAFGDGAVLCRMLDPAHLARGDLIDDLLLILGVDPAGPAAATLVRPPPQNRAPGWRVLEAMRALMAGRHGLPATHPLPAIAAGVDPRTMPMATARVLGLAADAIGEELGWNADRGRYLTRAQADQCHAIHTNAIARINARFDRALPIPPGLDERGFIPRDARPDATLIPPAQLRDFYDRLAAAYPAALAKAEATLADPANEDDDA